MTSNNQVSPVIRMSRGERDASARATHLKAASRKYLETTIERKQMSTTTNFKRIALVAVAALGLGVLSSVPSQATINADTLTLSSTTATQTTAETYTASSAVVTVSFFGAANDSVSITAALTSAPTGNTSLPTLRLVETSSASVETGTAGNKLAAGVSLIGETWTANSAATTRALSPSVVTTAKFAVYLTRTDGSTAPNTAGSYGVRITPTANGVGPLVGSVAQNLTITVTTAPADSVTPDPASSKIFVQTGTGTAATTVTPSTDSSTAVSKEVSSFPRAWIYFLSNNAALANVVESVTAEISGPGVLGASGKTLSSTGRSISVKYNDTVTVWSDGTEGKATVTLKGSTSGVTLGSKTVTFYGPTASFTAAAGKEILAIGDNAKAVTFTAYDSAKNLLNDEYTPAGGTQQTWYAFSSDTTVITAGTLAYSVDSGTVVVAGVKAGTATITIGNASTLAASTIKSNPVSVRVGSTSVASVKVAFDKSTYAPGEKAIITLSLNDANGLPVVPTATAYELWDVDYKLSTDLSFTNSTSIASETSVVLASTTVAGTSKAGAKTYVVYMPAVAGKVTLTGTLATNALAGRSLLTAAAIQGTTVTTSATVTDSGSAALAAVTALATTVASLKTLIVTLTNLVLKIQKKVKA